MPTNSESLNRELFRLLSKYKPKPLDAEGKATPVPEEADIFKFEFTKDGKDYGTVYVTLDDERTLTVYFGDDVTESPGDKTPGLDYDDSWSGLLHQLSSWRMTKGLRGFKTQNKDRVGDDMARRNHMRNKDKIAEGYYPMGKSRSYSDAVPSVKIVIEHSRVIEEGEQRYRNINRIFLENQDGERYLLDTKKPGIARVYARHIAEGGKVNDDRWSHIGNLCEEYQKMAGFVRATRNGQFNESAQALVNEGLEHYQSLRESLSRMTGKRGYNAYFESWTPTLMENEGEETNLNELFVQETLDPRIESVMPILSRLRKNIGEMKEVSALAEWADSIIEDESLTSNNPVGIPEGKGDFGKAIEQLSGWDEVEPYEPDTRQFDFDDDEGGYYAQGTVVQDLKTGQIKIEFKDDGEYGGYEINDTFNSIGDAMNSLRNITTRRSKSGKSFSRDSLAAKSLAGPDDVYKTDRAGKKGTLTKSRMDGMKASTQHTMRGGPKGVLPEGEVDEAINTGASLQRFKNDPRGNQKLPATPKKELDEFDIDTLNQLASHPMAGTLAAAGGAAIGATIGKGITKAADWYKNRQEKKAQDHDMRGNKVAEDEVDENFINQADQAVTSEGEHTQHAMRGRNPGANEFEHDFEPEDKVGNIHDKISKMLKKLSKPNHEPNMKDTDLGSTVLDEVDLGQYDAVKSTSNSGTTPEQEKEFRKKVQAYGQELDQRQKEKQKEKDNVKEGQEDFDAILRIIRK